VAELKKELEVEPHSQLRKDVDLWLQATDANSDAVWLV
jgi:hypothetical protein